MTAASGSPDASAAEILRSAQAHSAPDYVRSRQLPGGGWPTASGRCDLHEGSAAPARNHQLERSKPTPFAEQGGSPIAQLTAVIRRIDDGLSQRRLRQALSMDDERHGA